MKNIKSCGKDARYRHAIFMSGFSLFCVLICISSGMISFVSAGSVISEECAPCVAPGDYNERDVMLLAALIGAEAGGKSWFDMVSTGAEVVRRISDPRYPDTLAGVIFDVGAYASVSDGRIWSEPDYRAIQAARDALDGMLN